MASGGPRQRRDFEAALADFPIVAAGDDFH